MSFAFEKLLVYQKTVDFADAVCAHTEAFPRGYGFLVDQLNRAALSVSANIAEGNGRFTKRDRRNFFVIARGSAQECVPLPELAQRRQLVTESPPRSRILGADGVRYSLERDLLLPIWASAFFPEGIEGASFADADGKLPRRDTTSPTPASLLVGEPD